MDKNLRDFVVDGGDKMDKSLKIELSDGFWFFMIALVLGGIFIKFDSQICKIADAIKK